MVVPKGVLHIARYTERLHSKGVPFYSRSMRKGSDTFFVVVVLVFKRVLPSHLTTGAHARVRGTNRRGFKDVSPFYYHLRATLVKGKRDD